MRVADIFDTEGQVSVCQESTPSPARRLGLRRDRLLSNHAFAFFIIARLRRFRCYERGSTEDIRNLPVDSGVAADQVDVTRGIQAAVQVWGRAFAIIKDVGLGIDEIEREAGPERINSEDGLGIKSAGDQLEIRPRPSVRPAATILIICRVDLEPRPTVRDGGAYERFDSKIVDVTRIGLEIEFTPAVFLGDVGSPQNRYNRPRGSQR